jgi:tryptophan synthase beta chain
MKMLGATVIPATSGSKTLKDATNEAIRDWINNPNDTHYIIGSVVGPHPYPDMVTRFQSVISEEIKWQLKEKTGSEFPTHVIACVGGGSNAAGAFYHFLDEPSVQLIAVEAAGLGVDSGHSAATTALGKPGILHGSKSLVMQTEDGQVIEPHSISAGLDYPGIGPLHAYLFDSGRTKFLNATDDEALAAAFELAKLEGIIPALESAHALSSLSLLSLSEGEGGPADGIKFDSGANNLTNQGNEQIKINKDSVVVVCLSGRGDKDLQTYMNKMEEKK